MVSPLVSHLAHVELLAPDPTEAIDGLLSGRALTFVAADGRSVYLRGIDDPLSYSLKVTDAAADGLGHVAWRARGPQALQLAVTALAASGRGLGWTRGDVGHGPAYRFQGPSGHVHEVLWEADPRPARSPDTAMTRLDHVTLSCAATPDQDARFLVETLGFRPVPAPLGLALTVSGQGVDIAFVAAAAGARSVHHVGMVLAAHVAAPLASHLPIRGATAVSPAFSPPAT